MKNNKYIVVNSKWIIEAEKLHLHKNSEIQDMLNKRKLEYIYDNRLFDKKIEVS